MVVRTSWPFQVRVSVVPTGGSPGRDRATFPFTVLCARGSSISAISWSRRRFAAVESPPKRQLARDFPVKISVDTYKPAVAGEVLKRGVHWINDISGLRHPDMAPLIARFSAGVVIMHSQGIPESMQDDPRYGDCVTEIHDFLKTQIDVALKAGILPDQIMIDPGIGFGKTAEDNMELVANLDAFRSLGQPLVLGVSRKSFIGKILDLRVEDRLEGSLAAALVGVLKGADVLRVHDVKETLRAVTAFQGILQFERR